MKTTFLGQGFEEASINAVGYYLIEYLKSDDFHSFTGISAFASQAGVFGLVEYIQAAKQNFKNLTLIVGIDQGGTSKEALIEIKGLDIDSYIFYQKESPIFHPKIYLFEGDRQIKLIIGSSNLTGSGLFTNVEGSVLIEFNRNEKEGNDLLDGIRLYYKSMFDFSDANLFKINDTTISAFELKGLIPDEATRRKEYNKRISNATISTETSINIPDRKVPRIPLIFLRKNRSKNHTSSTAVTSTTAGGLELLEFQANDLVWISGPLTERDLNIPTGKTTHATGSMLLKKGELENIDQRHHFRDVVFSTLAWASDSSPKTTHLERATAFFYIFIDGIYKNVFPLMLTHNIKTDTPTYYQKNSMTSLSWGKAKNIIANKELLGKTIRLYRHQDSNDTYVMHIE